LIILKTDDEQSAVYFNNQKIIAYHLKVNTAEIKVIYDGPKMDRIEEKGEWPCSVCKKVVGSNSILHSSCKKWFIAVV